MCSFVFFLWMGRILGESQKIEKVHFSIFFYYDDDQGTPGRKVNIFKGIFNQFIKD